MVAVALTIASVLLITFMRRSLTNSVRTAAQSRAAEIARTVREPGWDGELSVTDDDVFVQVVAEDGEVVASTANAGADVLVEPLPGDAVELGVPFDDDPFLAVSYGVEVMGPSAYYRVVVGHSLDHVVESTQIILGLLGIGIPVLTLIVAFVAWRVVGGALSPVEAMRSQVEKMSADDLAQRVEVPPTDDEIASLARTMNGMLQRLQESYERQRRFVSDASHELRTPVSTIRQYVEVALRNPDGTTVPELAATVMDEDLRLQGIVEDLLLLARMDEGRLGTVSQPVDLDDVVLEGIHRLPPSEEVSVDASGVSGGRVTGDKKQLERLVGNLLDNARRHARGKVAVSLTSSDGAVVLFVEDDGNGIPDIDRERVFRRFERLDEARARDSGGAGLGLAIVAEVARAHGGRALIADSDLGGARFEIRFPAS